METGAADHFTKIDENEMAIMPIIKGRANGTGAVDFLMDVPFQMPNMKLFYNMLL
ncbi:hypothetical protein JCM16418A_12070 [Paenibacillus pini]